MEDKRQHKLFSCYIYWWILDLLLEITSLKCDFWNAYLCYEQGTLQYLQDYQSSLDSLSNYIRHSSFDEIFIMGDFNYAQLKFAHGKGADRGRHGRIRADKSRLGRARTFRSVIGADWGPIGFDRYFGGVTPPFCVGFGRRMMSLGIRRRLSSALRYP